MTAIRQPEALNTFTTAPDAYARSRPLYPEALFAWIVATCRNRDVVWDCATGNGQAAIALARLFTQVEATDISPEQVGRGFAAPNVRYSAQPAEATNFTDASFDLVTVAQALHWFDPARFWPEVRRVARPGALFCAWGYAWFRGSQDVGDALLGPVERLVAPFWAENNRILWRGYTPEEVGFPFRTLTAPTLSIEVDWSLGELIGYIRTWSAFKKAANAGRSEALERVIDDAAVRLGRESRHRLSAPLPILAGLIE